MDGLAQSVLVGRLEKQASASSFYGAQALNVALLRLRPCAPLLLASTYF